MVNALTFDIEDYYQVEAFKVVIRFEDWLQYPSRVAANTKKITDILNERNVKATFFVLGWNAERFPEMVKRLVDDGHEIASYIPILLRNNSKSFSWTASDFSFSKKIPHLTKLSIYIYSNKSLSKKNYVFARISIAKYLKKSEQIEIILKESIEDVLVIW